MAMRNRYPNARGTAGVRLDNEADPQNGNAIDIGGALDRPLNPTGSRATFWARDLQARRRQREAEADQAAAARTGAWLTRAVAVTAGSPRSTARCARPKRSAAPTTTQPATRRGTTTCSGDTNDTLMPSSSDAERALIADQHAGRGDGPLPEARVRRFLKGA
jgi:hypothetical protein